MSTAALVRLTTMTLRTPGLRPTVASAAVFCLEMYISAPRVRVKPTPRMYTPVRAELQTNLTLDPELRKAVQRYVDEWTRDLVEAWRKTPRHERLTWEPQKVSFRGLVYAALEECLLTNCWATSTEEVA